MSVYTSQNSLQQKQLKVVILWFYPLYPITGCGFSFTLIPSPVKQYQAVEIEGDTFSLVTVASAGLMRKRLEQRPTFHSPSHLLVFNQQSYGTEPPLNTKHPLTHPQNQSSNNRAIETAPGPARSPRTPTAHWQSDSASGAGIQKNRGKGRRSHFNAIQRLDEYSLQGLTFLMPLGWVEPWPLPQCDWRSEFGL